MAAEMDVNAQKKNSDDLSETNGKQCYGGIVGPVQCIQSSKAVQKSEEHNSQYSIPAKRGGWKTFPFIIGNELCAVAATTGLAANMIVYLTTQFNIKSIEATHIINITNGGNDLSPLVGAFLADAYLGRFWAVSIGSVISVIAMVSLMLTATIDSLRPPSCRPGSSCHGPSTGQLAVLYLYFALMIVASSGVRFNSMTFGADQFHKATLKGVKEIQSFFNWYFVVINISIVIAATVIVYVQASVSWAWGFGLCVALAATATILFFTGTKLYNRATPEGSPFTGLVQVVVAAVRKRHLHLPSNVEEFYKGEASEAPLALTHQLRFLNKAAIRTPQDIFLDELEHPDPWLLCTIRQVEDLKSILKTLPIWFGTIVPAIIHSQGITFAVLQALNMDRHLGSHFQIPAASYGVFHLLTSAIALAMYEKMVVPLAARKGKRITQLERTGTGMLISIVGMGVAAIVERKRLNSIQMHTHSSSIKSMSALWLVPQHVIMGVAEALQNVGRIDFFYAEFPSNVRSTSTAFVAAGMATGSYMSSLVVSVVHRKSGWLRNDLNMGRLDYFYTLLCIMGVLNLGYFIVCARWYEYKAKVFVAHNTSSA